MEVDKEYKGYVIFYLLEEEESFVMIKGDLEYIELLYVKQCLE